MRKRISVLLMAGILAVLSLAGCGGKQASFDVKALGNDLSTKIVYQDALTELDVDTASMFLNLSGFSIVNSAIYEGSGATAEEIVVLECASADDAAKAKTMLEERVKEQTESFTDYVPGELTKLGSALIKVNGNYAVLCVCDTPEEASKIIDQYM